MYITQLCPLQDPLLTRHGAHQYRGWGNAYNTDQTVKSSAAGLSGGVTVH